MDWFVLGIEPTTDKDAITKAYRAKLVDANPEEKPEAFKALRAAYDEALALAAKAAEPAPELTPVEQWLEEATALYKSLPRRLSVDAWKELLADPLCAALDTRPEVDEALLHFLMEHFYLTPEVWAYLIDAFSWNEREAELKETVDPDFVDFLLRSPESGAKVDLTYFTPGLDGDAADAYIRTVNRVERAESEEETKAALADLAALPEQHPYGDMLALVDRFSDGDQTAADEMELIRKQYPKESAFARRAARLFFAAERYEEAEAAARAAIEIDPKDMNARVALAHALAAQEKYADAVDQISNAMSLADGNGRSIFEMDQMRAEWNNKLIEQYEAKLAAEPDDVKLTYDLAWCYLQNTRYDEAYALAVKLPHEEPEPFGYYNLLSGIERYIDRDAECLEHVIALTEVTKNLQPDGTERTADRMKRVAEMYLRQADALTRLDRKDEIPALLVEARNAADGNADYLTSIAQMYLSLNMLEEADDVCDELIDAAPYSYHVYLLKSAINWRLRRDGVAYGAINEAIDQDGSILQSYQMKLALLIRNEVWGEVRALIDFLKENGITEDALYPYAEAMMLRRPEDGHEPELPELEQALALMNGVAQQIESGEADAGDWGAEFYCDLAHLTANVNDLKKEYGRDVLMDLLQKGLAIEPTHAPCMDYLAWLLRREKRKDEALELYERLLTTPGRPNSLEQSLAELYYDDLAHKAPQALEMYQKVQERQPDNGDIDFYIGMCYYRMGRFAEAEKHFLEEQRKAPDDIDGYSRLARVYLAMNRLDEALEQSQKTISIAKTWDADRDTQDSWIPLMLAMRRLGRPQEAVAAIRESMAYNPKHSYRFHRMVDTYLQFGMFDAAAAAIKEWKKDKQEKKETESISYAELRLEALQRRFTALRLSLLNRGSQMDKDDARFLQTILNCVDGKFDANVKIAQEQYDAACENNKFQTRELGHLIWDLWCAGRDEEAKPLAEKCLAQLEEQIAEYSSSRTMMISRRILPLAALGRFAEAHEMLELTKSLPLCEQCQYGICKDAWIFEVELLAVEGKWPEALALADECATRWPDEEDFISEAEALRHIIKKGKR